MDDAQQKELLETLRKYLARPSLDGAPVRQELRAKLKKMLDAVPTTE